MKKQPAYLIPIAMLTIAAAREWLRLGAPTPALDIPPMATIATAGSITAAVSSTVKQARAESERAELLRLLRWTAGQVPEELRVGMWWRVEEMIQ